MSQAQEFANRGHKKEAREILRKILTLDQRNEQAWLLFANISEKPEDEIQCLSSVIKINPNNIEARQRLENLSLKESKVSDKANTSVQTNSGSGNLKRYGLLGGGIIIVLMLLCCIFFIIIGPANLFSSTNKAVNNVPTNPINVSVLVDITSILNSSVLDVQNKYRALNSLSMIPSTSPENSMGDNPPLTEGGYWQTFAINDNKNYEMEITFDNNKLVKDISIGNINDIKLQLKDWPIVMKMFNMNVNQSPTVFHTSTGIEWKYVWNQYEGLNIYIINSIESGFKYINSFEVYKY